MSGSTIGGVVGATIGFFAGGNVQLGWMIGSAIGAMVDPQKIEGPKIAEMTIQSSQDGVSRVYGYGTFLVKQTWVPWRSEVRKFRKKQSAKGGPQQVTHHASVSYAVAVCRGPISGFKIITEDGKVVFDARTDAELGEVGYTSQQISETRAAQAQFLRNTTFYYGTDDQMPDPTMVAVEGAGNVPAYSGTAYFVKKDQDITDRRSIPIYEVVVSTCGTRHEGEAGTAKLLITGTAIAVGDPVMVVGDAVDVPTLVGIPVSTGADLANGIAEYYGGVACVVAERSCRYSQGMQFDDWQSSSIPLAPSASVHTLAGGPGGWVVGAGGSFTDILAKAPPVPATFEDWAPTITPLGPGEMTTVGSSVYVGEYFFDAVLTTSGNVCATVALGSEVEMRWEAVDNDVLRPFFDMVFYSGARYVTSKKQFGTGRIQLVYTTDGCQSFADPLIDIAGDETPEYQPFQLASGIVNGAEILLVLCWGGEYIYSSADDFATPHLTGIGTKRAVGGISVEDRAKKIRFANGQFFVVSGYNDDPSKANKIVTTTDGLTFSNPVSIPLQNVRSIAVADGESSVWEPIPDAPGFYVNRETGEIVGPSGIQIDPCTPTLGSIVSAQCNSRNVSTIDVSELTDYVIGYRVSSPSSAQRNIAGMIPAKMFDASEFDGVLHFPKRKGRTLTFALTPDDYVARDGEPIQWTSTQEPELLRKYTVGYMEPTLRYQPTTQQWERRAGTVKAEGEGVTEFPMVMSADEAAQAAHINGKVAWSENQEGSVHVSIERAELVTAAVGTIEDLDGEVHTVRITQIKDEGLVRMLTVRRTWLDVYESAAYGARKPLPAFPGSSIRGPTDGLLLNIPVLVDTNDVPGIHWAAAGMTAGWAGTQLQILRAGQWTVAGETSDAALVGTLMDALPYHAGDIDTVNVLRMRVTDDLETVTFDNLLQERNPLAILRPDGTAEIVQFQTATEVSPHVYECTTLLRNRLDTGASAHAASARMVFLDENVQYTRLEPTDIGQTISYRFVTLGTDPDAAPVQTLLLSTMESQREWPVFDFRVERDGDDFHLTWGRRDRLGSDVFPVRSLNWSGYIVGWSSMGTQHQEIVMTEGITYTLPGASDITFRVSQTNQFTGEGPESTVYFP